MGWTPTIYTARPVFVADFESIARNTGGQIDWNKVPASYIQGTRYTIEAAAQANAGATSITVAALPVDLPVGTILDFEGAGKFAILTAHAAKGATTLTVEALDAQIDNEDEAIYLVSASGKKAIRAGTVMVQITGGKYVPRADRPGSEEAVGLLFSMATEDSNVDALTGYGILVGGVIYENLLPETITSYKSELASNGAGFVWVTYKDGRET